MRNLSVILMPTLGCNAACRHCYQPRSQSVMPHALLKSITTKLADYMDELSQDTVSITWQGGEILTVGPEWFEVAMRITGEVERSRHKIFEHSCITNLLEYGDEWSGIIREMLGNCLSSSIDFPNIYRVVDRQKPESFTRIWRKKLDEARNDGIDVGVTSVVNHETLTRGSKEFYEYYATELGIRRLQLNLIFAADWSGKSNVTSPLDNEQLGDFLVELADIYLEKGRSDGILIDYLERIIGFFSNVVPANMLCELSPNCVHDLLCIDPGGNVLPCDNWHRFPEYWYGNIAGRSSLSEVLSCSARRELVDRPLGLLGHGDCAGCEYLAICHGGCALRSMCANGDPWQKDPHCKALKRLFAHIRRCVLMTDGN